MTGFNQIERSRRSRGRLDGRIQACYQHACLLFEDGKQMTNQSLRERLSIGKNNSAMVSRLIADSVAAGLIKPSSEDTESNKFKSYIPYYG